MNPEWLFATFGTAFFWVTIAIVFIECGLFFPILPGDSLLFAVGMFIGNGSLKPFGADPTTNLIVISAALFLAAFGGNVCGYEIGRAIGTPLYERDGRILKRKYFDQTTAFFEKYGAKALIIGRFVPIVRTFITVVAGVGKMNRRHFYTWSAVGALLWVGVMLLLGYFLGKIPFVQKHFEYAAVLIIVVSVIPMIIEFFKHRRAAKLAPAEAAVKTEEALDAAEREEGERLR